MLPLRVATRIKVPTAFAALPHTPQDKKLGELPAYKELLNTFINKEIIRWPVVQATYQSEIAAQPDIFSGERKMSCIIWFGVQSGALSASLIVVMVACL